MNKTKIEIIDETVEVYSVPGSRSINMAEDPELSEGRCLYNGPDGKHCAFARVVENPEILEERQNCRRLIKELGVEIKFKEGYEGHGRDFWWAIQHLHDNDNHWAKDGGLTGKGRAYVEELKLKYQGS